MRMRTMSNINLKKDNDDDKAIKKFMDNQRAVKEQNDRLKNYNTAKRVRGVQKVESDKDKITDLDIEEAWRRHQDFFK